MGEISDKVTKKNQDVAVEEVFTNSAEFGIISQRDFFDKDIANAENIDGYYALTANRYDNYLVSLDNFWRSEEGDDVTIASPKYLFDDLEINAFSSCEGDPVEWQVILRKK